MRVDDLRDSVEGIHMKDKMRNEIIENVKKRAQENRKNTENTADTIDQTDRGKGAGIAKNIEEIRPTAGWRKATAAAVVLIAVSGIVAFPVRALVNSLVQERLEEMSEEEIEEVYNSTVSSEAEADSFSRAYTESESWRYQELAEKYKKGTFPQQEIVQAGSEEEVKQDELCFIIPSSTFYLPDRELTDEEILEIIDFSVKRDYALRQNYEKENAQEIAQKEEEDKQKIAENVESGGITQQQAVEIATDRLYTFFASSGEGMELNSYYSENGHLGTGDACYTVTWMDPVTHKCYYIDLGAQDGHVMWAAQTDPASDMSELTIEEAKEKIGILRADAEEFMKKLGIGYENVYVYYLESAEGMVNRDGVRFVFEAPDHGACGVTYRWNGMLGSYEEVDLADYQERDGKSRTLHIKGEEIEMMQVFQRLDAKQQF